jgi:hypothetical protein
MPAPPEQNISLRNLCKNFWLEETAILDMQMSKLPMISGYGSIVMSNILSYRVFLCSEVRYDSHIKALFGFSTLYQLVCRWAPVLSMLFVFVPTRLDYVCNMAGVL